MNGKNNTEKVREKENKNISFLIGVLNTASHVVVLKLQKMNPPRPTFTNPGQMRYDREYKLQQWQTSKHGNLSKSVISHLFAKLCLSSAKPHHLHRKHCRAISARLLLGGVKAPDIPQQPF